MLHLRDTEIVALKSELKNDKEHHEKVIVELKTQSIKALKVLMF